MIHPSTQLRYIDDRFGYGVFAVGLIPRGTVVWAKDSFDQTFAPAQLDSLAKPQRRILEKYGFAFREGILVLVLGRSPLLKPLLQPERSDDPLRLRDRRNRHSAR